MIAVVQRVTSSSVSIEGKVVGKIQTGFMVLLGVCHPDTQEDADWLSKKILGLRVFADEDGKMNKDLGDVNGNVLLVSQFTLHASTKKGNRPSFFEAARPEQAIPLYEKMADLLSQGLGKRIETGVFGADMRVSIENDGPVTIIIDSQNKK
jgi:D-aminoacyl-tRNA deacylase